MPYKALHLRDPMVGSVGVQTFNVNVRMRTTVTAMIRQEFGDVMGNRNQPSFWQMVIGGRYALRLCLPL